MALGAAVLLAPLLAGVAKLLSFETLKFIATRAMLLSLFTLVLPVVLYNVYTGIVSEVLTYAGGLVGSVDPAVIQLTGMAAWIAEKINLGQAMSMYLSACGLRFVLSFLVR